MTGWEFSVEIWAIQLACKVRKEVQNKLDVKKKNTFKSILPKLHHIYWSIAFIWTSQIINITYCKVITPTEMSHFGFVLFCCPHAVSKIFYWKVLFHYFIILLFNWNQVQTVRRHCFPPSTMFRLGSIYMLTSPWEWVARWQQLHSQTPLHTERNHNRTGGPLHQ